MKNMIYPSIVIVGAGATGVAAFIALVRRRAAKRITLIDPYVAGQGQAYANTDPEILCNTSVDLMSVLPLENNDLLHYLHDHGHRHITSEDLIPRQQVGSYIRERFKHYSKLAEEYGIEVRQIQGYALRIVRTNDNSYVIETKNGQRVTATDVIVCNGYNSPVVPESINYYVNDPSICISPYPEKDMKQKMSPYHRILVLGSKLSAIDASLVLCRDKHQVTMVSPSGKLPAVRTCLVRSPKEVVSFAKVYAADIDYHVPGFEQKLSKLVKSTIAMISSLPLNDQIAMDHNVVSLLRKETELAKSGKTHWQYAVIALCDALNFVIKPQDRILMQKIKQGYHSLLSRYLSAIPLQNAQKLLHYIDNNCLQVLGKELSSIERNKNQWRVRWSSGECATFDGIVCATGQYPPLFNATNDTLTFVSDPKASVIKPELTSDLMVKLPKSNKTERIWLVGIPSHISVPAVNALYIGVRQANEVAQKIAESQLQIS